MPKEYREISGLDMSRALRDLIIESTEKELGEAITSHEETVAELAATGRLAAKAAIAMYSCEAAVEADVEPFHRGGPAPLIRNGKKVEHGLYIVFDGPPGPESGRFVEVEDEEGRSVQTQASWTKRKDGFWVLGPFRDKKED
jgi:hypothetical protein